MYTQGEKNLEYFIFRQVTEYANLIGVAWIQILPKQEGGWGVRSPRIFFLPIASCLGCFGGRFMPMAT
jgi:hypothetical protein